MAATVFKNPSFWIAERCDIVRREYKSVPAKLIGEKIGCTAAAVHAQAFRMGLRKIRQRNFREKQS